MNSSCFKILMFPWLAYGHISPELELAKKLTDRGLFIYFCSTPINLGFIKKKIPEKYSNSIQLVELHLPDTPELPPHYHTTNGLPHHLMPTLTKALKMAKPNLSNILKTLKPDLVVYDVYMPWPAALTAVHNIPAVKFSSASVASLAYFFHLMDKPGVEFPFPAIHLHGFDLARLRAIAESGKKTDAQDDNSPHEDEVPPKRFCDNILLVKSSREIEAKYMDHLSVSGIKGRKVVSVGALFQDPVYDNQEGINNNDNELIQWLGTKGERSSLFVSFGSEYFLKKEEMEELAYGLELSNVNFIWVLRFPGGDKTIPEDALPDGFLERVRNRGRIVEGWAPQAKILGHPCIGGFISHCGWGSVMESIQFGVPIIAMPMHLDQPFNARLVVEIGAGVEILRDENGKLDRQVIAKVIKDVVVVEKMGENVRRKMRDLSEKMKLREKEELDEVVALLTQLCEEK